MPRVRKSETPHTLSDSPLPLPREATRGIQLNVPGRELVVRLGERIRWHRERADALILQMKKVAEVEREAADDLLDILGQYASPRKPLEKRVREHQDRAAFLTFLRDHIDAHELYRLDSADLRMTEILPDKPW